mmetsp:Transcript_13701/g.51083  ORF Transcript_13701/g.51083 Transcript_13701/m.51083 type:complete len:389 (+) Transcript_13701:155-1321(+)
MRHEGLLEVAVAAVNRLVPIPVYSFSDPVFPGHLFAPPQLLKLVRIDGVAEIVEAAVRHERDEGVLLLVGAHEGDQLVRHLLHAPLVPASNVVDLADPRLVQDADEGICDIRDVEEVPRVPAVAVDGHRAAAHQLVRELGNQLFWILMGTVHVVAPGDDDGQVETAVEALGHELGTSLRGRIRVGRLEHLVLEHGLRVEGLALAVHLIGGHVDEAPDLSKVLRAFQQHVRAHDVVVRELEGVAEAVVHVRLRGEVHDRVDVVLRKDVHHKVAAEDVALHELVVGALLDLFQILRAAAVVDLVHVDDVVVRKELAKSNHLRRAPDFAKQKVNIEASSQMRQSLSGSVALPPPPAGTSVSPQGFMRRIERLTTCDAMKPAPPVMRMFCGS